MLQFLTFKVKWHLRGRLRQLSCRLNRVKLNREKCSNNRNRQGPSGSEAKFQFKQLLLRDMGTFLVYV